MTAGRDDHSGLLMVLVNGLANFRLRNMVPASGSREGEGEGDPATSIPRTFARGWILVVLGKVAVMRVVMR